MRRSDRVSERNNRYATDPLQSKRAKTIVNLSLEGISGISNIDHPPSVSVSWVVVVMVMVVVLVVGGLFFPRRGIGTVQMVERILRLPRKD